ncbi:MAG: uroporphyrinogen decarboxylase family protein [bacterium]
MSKMTKKERVLATFKHQETDRVPLYDLMLNDDCIEYFTGYYPPYGEEGARLQAQAVDRMLDMARGVGVSPNPPPLDFTDDPDLLEYARYSSLTYRYNPIKTYESAIEWVKNQILVMSKWRENINLRETAENTRRFFEKLYSWMDEDHVVCCLRQSGVGLDDIRGTLGIEFFSYLDADNPELISEYLELYTQREVAIIHAIADPEISPFALTYGDIAMKAKLIHPPEWLRREFFPRLKRLNDAYHEHGIYCLFHSDGYLMEVMPDLIETGIDGLNPIEVVAGMDVGEVYNLYGDKIFLTGGIDMSQLLSNGTPDQVIEVCRKTIEKAPRGYFMGSTTEIDNTSRLENVLAMIEVSWGYFPTGAKPDIMEQIKKRKEQVRRRYKESSMKKPIC